MQSFSPGAYVCGIWGSVPPCSGRGGVANMLAVGRGPYAACMYVCSMYVCVPRQGQKPSCVAVCVFPRRCWLERISASGCRWQAGLGALFIQAAALTPHRHPAMPAPWTSSTEHFAAAVKSCMEEGLSCTCMQVGRSHTHVHDEAGRVLSRVLTTETVV